MVGPRARAGHGLDQPRGRAPLAQDQRAHGRRPQAQPRAEEPHPRLLPQARHHRELTSSTAPEQAPSQHVGVSLWRRPDGCIITSHKSYEYPLCAVPHQQQLLGRAPPQQVHTDGGSSDMEIWKCRDGLLLVRACWLFAANCLGSAACSNHPRITTISASTSSSSISPHHQAGC